MRHLNRFATILFALLAITSFTANAHAQGDSTELRTEDLSAFAALVNANPGHGPDRNTGGSFGIDFTRYFAFPIHPSAELRASFDSGPIVDEKSYLVGVRAQADLFHRYQPYADFLIGEGRIVYYVPPAPGYTHDNSITPTYGLGVDVRLVQHFAAKIDFQQQHWAFDSHNTISPTMLTIGLTYHIPFRPYIRGQDLGQ